MPRLPRLRIIHFDCGMRKPRCHADWRGIGIGGGLGIGGIVLAIAAYFTHGSSAQRVRWFKRGMDSGLPKDCDTFAADSL